MALLSWFRREQDSDLELKLLHDLGNSLTCIKGYSQLLLNHQNPDKDALRTIDFCSQQAIGLMQDLMDQESLKRGDLTLRRKPIVIEDLLSQVADGYDVICKSKGIALKKKIHSSGTVVLADSRRISQVLANLLSNAIRHSQSGGSVTVSMLPQDDCAYITVQDTGEGVPFEQQNKIFDKFYQSGTNSGSMGLGLSICQEIVTRHDGQIGVTSSGRGQGSCFYFTVPYGAAAPKEDKNEGSSAAIKALAGGLGIITALLCLTIFRQQIASILPQEARLKAVVRSQKMPSPSISSPQANPAAPARRLPWTEMPDSMASAPAAAATPAKEPVQNSLYSAKEVAQIAKAFGKPDQEKLVDSLASVRANLENKVAKAGLQFDGTMMQSKSVEVAVPDWRPAQNAQRAYSKPIDPPVRTNKQMSEIPPVPDNIVMEPTPESRWTNPILLFAGGIGLAGALMLGSSIQLSRKSAESVG